MQAPAGVTRLAPAFLGAASIRQRLSLFPGDFHREEVVEDFSIRLFVLVPLRTPNVEVQLAGSGAGAGPAQAVTVNVTVKQRIATAVNPRCVVTPS